MKETLRRNYDPSKGAHTQASIKSPITVVQSVETLSPLLFDMLGYQITAALLNAKKLTGIDFVIDSDLKSGEFVPVGEGDIITRFHVPNQNTWEMVVFLLVMVQATASPILSFLSRIPVVRHVVLYTLARRWANKLL